MTYLNMATLEGG